jgi:hypothetical protein
MATNTFLDVFKEHNGKTVHHDGILNRIEYGEIMAVYPYPHVSRSCYLTPVNKNTKGYLKIKRALGDDWSTDITSISDNAFVKILDELKGGDD